MFLKPKSTHLNRCALHYRKIIDIATTYSAEVIYKATINADTFYCYIFDRTIEDFVKINNDTNAIFPIPVSNTIMLSYNGYYFEYDFVNLVWDKKPLDENKLILPVNNAWNSRTNQIGYYVRDREFDYTLVSDVNKSEEQLIKGLVVDLETFDIKFSDDNLHMENEDIVQIKNDLYVVSDLSYKILRSPKELIYYFCTLTKLKV